MTVQYIITFEAKEDAKAAFGALMEDIKYTLPDVKGCRGVRILKSAKHQNQYTLIEEWQSESDHQHNIDSLIASGDWNYINSLLATDPVGSYYKEL